MKVLLFGITRDIIGSSELDLPEQTAARLKSVNELKEYITGEYPALNKLTSMAIAVNNEYAEGKALIRDTDEIALIPPVSGG